MNIFHIDTSFPSTWRARTDIASFSFKVSIYYVQTAKIDKNKVMILDDCNFQHTRYTSKRDYSWIFVKELGGSEFNREQTNLLVVARKEAAEKTRLRTPLCVA